MNESTGAALPFSHRVRVYWEDTDGGGVVYHAQYVAFLERARTEWLRALGIEQTALKADEDRIFAIRSMQIDFRAPAKLDDELDVRVESVRVGGASLLFAQSIRRVSDGAVLVTAEVKAASLTASTFRPLALTDALRRRFDAAAGGPGG